MHACTALKKEKKRSRDAVKGHGGLSSIHTSRFESTYLRVYPVSLVPLSECVSWVLIVSIPMMRYAIASSPPSLEATIL